jgi:hypothetical protein
MRNTQSLMENIDGKRKRLRTAARRSLLEGDFGEFPDGNWR